MLFGTRDKLEVRSSNGSSSQFGHHALKIGSSRQFAFRLDGAVVQGQFAKYSFVCLSFGTLCGSGVLASSIFVAAGIVWSLRQAGGVI